MKGYKPFSRKYYTEEVVKSIARYFLAHSSYIGQKMHDGIEGIKHENDAWKYGGSEMMTFCDNDFEYRLIIHRKSAREKATK